MSITFSSLPNYLDLLHKELRATDTHKEILFKDDNQIKILIVNYYIKTEREKGEIYIETQSIGDFIKDLELIDKIDVEKENNYPDDFDTSLEGLSSLEEIKEVLGENYHSLRKYWVQQVQESFLKTHNLSVAGLVSLFRSRFFSQKRYSDFAELQEIFKEQERLIIFATNFLEFGKSPSKNGESRSEFKAQVRIKLDKFKEKYKILFPLLQPIRVNILFILPKSNVADLDNIARYIIPFVNEVFQPPSDLHRYLNKPSSDENEENLKPIPPNSISGYQIINIPRKETDDENGTILFVVSEGCFSWDLWSEISSRSQLS